MCVRRTHMFTAVQCVLRIFLVPVAYVQLPEGRDKGPPDLFVERTNNPREA